MSKLSADAAISFAMKGTASGGSIISAAGVRISETCVGDIIAYCVSSALVERSGQPLKPRKTRLRESYRGLMNGTGNGRKGASVDSDVEIAHLPHH